MIQFTQVRNSRSCMVLCVSTEEEWVKNRGYFSLRHIDFVVLARYTVVSMKLEIQIWSLIDIVEDFKLNNNEGKPYEKCLGLLGFMWINSTLNHLCKNPPNINQKAVICCPVILRWECSEEITHLKLQRNLPPWIRKFSRQLIFFWS